MQVAGSIARLELAETFVISRESQDTAEVVQVELEHDGVSGFGEGAPIGRYDESAESALQYIEESADALGDDPFALDEIHARLEPREWAGRAALDAALHDLQGKLAGVPVWKLLGVRRLGPPTSWTIWLGDPDDMGNRAARVADRFLRLKLKLGARDGRDVDRVRAVRETTEAPLQVDVNEYWTLDEALDTLPQLAELDVEYCEQPLPAGDPDGAHLKAASPIPIYVEACQVGRHPRSRPHGARCTRTRPRRDARLHDRVRAWDRGRSAGRATLRPRRPRRQPAARARSVAGRRASRRHPGPCRRTRSRCQRSST